MTRDEIDAMLDAMAAEAAQGSDETLLPGAINFHSGTWVRMSQADLPTTCVNTIIGIRYRGVSVLISSQRDNKVQNRREDEGQGGPYLDLEPKA
ncbi:hypothetical protein [Caulobacter segnis]|uniref:Uncharacterized protein n=1 Tax=Caulobacter segnis TaxID=88688 RepID=A0A2W5WYM8_9CAUL|nr:hypothetical protein [Caulobacter segnis]PZR33224.1 MAG: hypothetical protein DI526_14100 [Caulobacter segnis]